MSIYKALGTALVAALCVVGCGGNEPHTAAVDDPATYEGSYSVSCFQHPWLREGAQNGPQVQAAARFTLVKIAGDALGFRMTQQFFSSTDTTCTGSILATEVSDSNRFTFDGQTRVLLHGVSTPAMRIAAIYMPPSNPLDSGSAATVVGPLAYPQGYFTTPRSGRYLLLLAGKILYFGDETQPLDAQGYPTVLEVDSGAIKD